MMGVCVSSCVEQCSRCLPVLGAQLACSCHHPPIHCSLPIQPIPFAGKELEEILAAHPPVQPESVPQVTAEPLDNLLPA